MQDPSRIDRTGFTIAFRRPLSVAPPTFFQALLLLRRLLLSISQGMSAMRCEKTNDVCSLTALGSPQF